MIGLTPAFDTLLRIASLVLGALAVYGAGIFLLRRRIFMSISRLPERKRDQTVQRMARVAVVRRLLFILSPVYIVLLPFILDRYGGPHFRVTATAFGLLYLNLLENSIYSSWLTRALMALKETGSAAA